MAPPVLQSDYWPENKHETSGNAAKCPIFTPRSSINVGLPGHNTVAVSGLVRLLGMGLQAQFEPKMSRKGSEHTAHTLDTIHQSVNFLMRIIERKRSAHSAKHPQTVHKWLSAVMPCAHSYA